MPQFVRQTVLHGCVGRNPERDGGPRSQTRRASPSRAIRLPSSDERPDFAEMSCRQIRTGPAGFARSCVSEGPRSGSGTTRRIVGDRRACRTGPLRREPAREGTGSRTPSHDAGSGWGLATCRAAGFADLARIAWGARAGVARGREARRAPRLAAICYLAVTARCHRSKRGQSFGRGSPKSEMDIATTRDGVDPRHVAPYDPRRECARAQFLVRDTRPS